MNIQEGSVRISEDAREDLLHEVCILQVNANFQNVSPGSHQILSVLGKACGLQVINKTTKFTYNYDDLSLGSNSVFDICERGF